MKPNSIFLRRLLLVALLAALTCIGAFLRFPLPFSPVPVTLQTFFVLLCGFLLGPKDGALAQLLYILLGLCGLPVFSTGGGIGYVLTPGFGYLIGFVACTLLMGAASRRYLKNGAGLPAYIALGTVGLLLCYLIAVLYMYFILNVYTDATVSMGHVLLTGFAVFLPGEVLKVIAAALAAKRLLKILPDV